MTGSIIEQVFLHFGHPAINICIDRQVLLYIDRVLFRKLVMFKSLSSRILREFWANTQWYDSYNGAWAINPYHTWEQPSDVRSRNFRDKSVHLKEELHASPSICFLPTARVFHCMHVPMELRLIILPHSPKGVVLGCSLWFQFHRMENSWGNGKINSDHVD